MRCFVIPAALVALAPIASAQGPQPYRGEIVMNQSGSLNAPWKEGRACTSSDACKAIVYNSKTREIARFGEEWSSDFSPTGLGKEVMRSETTAARAKRLQVAG